MDAHGHEIEAARQAIAGEIRARRARLRLTQLQLAQKSGISRATLARMEAGEKDATYPDLIRFAKVFDTTPLEFLQSAQDSMEQLLSKGKLV